MWEEPFQLTGTVTLLEHTYDDHSLVIRQTPQK